MPYSKVGWQNGSGPTLYTGLLNMDQGIYDAHYAPGAALYVRKDYGAAANGTTNDAPAINAALAAAAGTRPVILEGGTFAVSSTINLTTANQELIIARGATLKLGNAANTTLLQINAANVKVTGGGTLDGNYANQTTAYSGHCVNFASGATNAELSGLEVKNSPYAGVKIGGASRNRVIGNYIHDTQIQGVYGTWETTSCDYNLIQGNYVYNTNLSNLDGSGITFVGTCANTPDSGVYLLGNRVIGNFVDVVNSIAICIELQQGARSAVIADNVCVGGFMGISLGVNDSTAVTGNTTRAANDYCGIEIAQSRYCSATGNTIDGQGITQWGFSVGQIGLHHTIAGNTILNLAAGAANTSYAFFMNGADHIIVADNNILSPNLNSGVRFQSSSHGRVMGNNIRIDPNTNSGSAIAIFNSSDDTSIVGNTFRGAPNLLTADATTTNVNYRANYGIGYTNILNTGATTLTGVTFSDNVPATLDTVEQAASNVTPVTANTNTTAAQNLMSASVAGWLLNKVGNTLRVRGAGLYTTQTGLTPTLTLTVSLGGVTIATFGPTAATTAAISNIPWNFELLLTTASAGSAATIEAHGEFRTRLAATGVLNVYADTNTAASAAIDLTTAKTLQVTWTFSTNGATPNTATQRQLVAQAGG